MLHVTTMLATKSNASLITVGGAMNVGVNEKLRNRKVKIINVK
jgi:N-dimethylarginine dimethylaminohydrolase